MFAYNAEFQFPRSPVIEESPRIQELRQAVRLLAEAVQQRRQLDEQKRKSTLTETNTAELLDEAPEDEPLEDDVSENVSEETLDRHLLEETDVEESSKTGTDVSEISLRHEPLQEKPAPEFALGEQDVGEIVSMPSLALDEAISFFEEPESESEPEPAAEWQKDLPLQNLRMRLHSFPISLNSDPVQ